MTKKILLGTDIFEKLIRSNGYYIDKTELIRDVIERGGKVTLFIRPRRFGKTLALSMLRTFFELEYDLNGAPVDNSRYFAGKKIMEFCREVLDVEIKGAWEICRIGELLPPNDKGEMKLKPGTKQVDIVGYTFTTTTTRVRAGSFLKIRRLAKRIDRRLKAKGCVILQNAQAMLSRIGWFTHSDSRHFTALYIKPYINIKFIKGILSYADKNRIVGKTARIYCKPGRQPGSYHILYGRAGSAA